MIERIESQELRDVISNAIDFENRSKNYATCFQCGEEIDRDKYPDTIPDCWECKNKHKVESAGWEWYDVAKSWHLVSKLLKMNICYMKRRSNKHTEYKLTDRSKAEQIISDTVPESPTDFDELFSSIVGYDDIKKLIMRIIENDIDMHMLFVGPPASSKTLFQLEIEKLPGAMFMTGSNITKSGLTALLMDNDIRYLIIDEIDDMKTEDAAPLMTLMSTGRITETKYGRTRSKEMKISVFGSCNSTRRMRGALLSRFVRITFKPYTYDQFVEITKHVLPVSDEFAEKIAYAVWNELGSRDVRDVFKIHKLMPNPTDSDLKLLVDILNNYKD